MRYRVYTYNEYDEEKIKKFKLLREAVKYANSLPKEFVYIEIRNIKSQKLMYQGTNHFLIRCRN